jgi:thiosulfate dehydrogenase [quinone] large subunit
MQLSHQPALAFLAFRLGLGVNLLLHGLTRLPMLAQFVAKTVEQFHATILPEFLVRAFAYSVSFIEASLGLLLLLGLQTGWALFAANLLICSLMFGTALRQDWATLGLQMTYAVAFFLAHLHVQHDRFSLDALLHRRA